MPKEINGVIIKTYRDEKPIIFLAKIKEEKVSSENMYSIEDKDNYFAELGIEDIILVNYSCVKESEGLPLTIEKIKRINIFTTDFHSLFEDPNWFEKRINEIIHIESQNENIKCSNSYNYFK